MVEELLFTIENNKIAELFGLQNFSSKEVAVLELVKNSYDAGATEVIISISESSLVIEDNGIGMTKDIIKEKWMHVGVSNKQYNFISIDNKERVYSGSKGIGRFALARLGSKIELVTKTKDSGAVCWKTDWDVNLLDDYSGEISGTRIIIKELHDKWNLYHAQKLASYISMHKNCSDLSINVVFGEEKIPCKNAMEDVALGNNALSLIEFGVDSENALLSVSINSVEFSEKAQMMVDEYNSNPNNSKRIIAEDVSSYKRTINLLDVLSFESIESDSSFSGRIKNVGSFKGIIYFNNNYTKRGADEFYYSWPKTVSDFPNDTDGLFIFRNAFCISGYDGSEDWLNLRKRVRISPAAATHKSGRWRVRDNQILGKIFIDKKINSNIIELQNRQGIEENESFDLFKQTIRTVLDCFEEYRQSIIRIVNEKNFREITEEEQQSKKTVDSFLKNPFAIHRYSDKEISMLATGFKTFREDLNREKNDYEKKKTDLDYANRLLNSLSTMGLKSASIAHELNNKRNNIVNAYDFIVESLKYYGLWDSLSDSEHTKQKKSNVPLLLSDVRDINEIVINYIDSMLVKIDKSKFKKAHFNVKGVVEDIANRWRNEYSWISIKIDAPKTIDFYLTVDAFDTIFDNLILNSVQQNNKSESLNIYLSMKKKGNRLYLTYRDDGVGLNDKYKQRPFKILEPHESSRENGHGLGMWILYTTVLNNNGEIMDIDGGNGFEIKFYLEEFNNGEN